MKRQDLMTIIVAGVIAAFFALIISHIFFGPKSRHTPVPTVEALPQSFPDVKNDPAYQSFLNNKALDPTLPIHIGGGNNKAPFNSPQ